MAIPILPVEERVRQPRLALRAFGLTRQLREVACLLLQVEFVAAELAAGVLGCVLTVNKNGDP
jgi:hypothetical protein